MAWESRFEGLALTSSPLRDTTHLFGIRRDLLYSAAPRVVLIGPRAGGLPPPSHVTSHFDLSRYFQLHASRSQRMGCNRARALRGRAARHAPQGRDPRGQQALRARARALFPLSDL